MSIRQVAKNNILEAVGNTPIVKLNKIGSHLSVDLYVKCEFMNPAGSIKDRIAIHMINEAEKKGLLKPGGTIIEPTSGNTGLGLAMLAAVRGYKCIFTLADKQSQEKRNALTAAGAKIIVCPTDVPPDDPRSYYEVAKRLAQDTPNSFSPNQYGNQTNPDAHYLSTGPEIWQQCGDSLNYLVCGLGTGGTVSGIAKYLKEKNPRLAVIGVDPVGSIYYELFYKGTMGHAHPYLVEGIGEDFLPSTMDMKCLEHVVQVNDEDSFIVGRRLVREEGIFAGGSSGSAVCGAVRFFEQNPQTDKGARKTVLIILPDAANRYTSKYFNDDWMKQQHFRLQ